MPDESEFSGWAVLEIFGHSKEIGYVSTKYFGGPALFRVDQPPLPERKYVLTSAQWIGEKLAGVGTEVLREAVPGKTAFVGPSAIFRMTPCSEETAIRAVEELIPAPIKILHLVERKQIPAAEADYSDGQDRCVECNELLRHCQCG